MDTLLLIDDDPLLLESLSLHFASSGPSGEPPKYTVLTAESAAAGLELARTSRPSLVLLDVQLPDRTGLELIGEIKAAANEVPVVVITGHHDMATTIRAMKAGAFDYLQKPFHDPDSLTLVVERALHVGRLSRRAALAVDTEQPLRLDDIVSESPLMQRIVKEIGKVAASQATVLIQGESGTGKELVARVIHNYSSDEARPFVAINCSAIVDTLLESELFGHERGSFTGAVGLKVGKCELAADGTLFLDEIGDMSLGLQAKLLRVLQEREFERVGGVKRIPLRARVIAATNRDLAQEVVLGHFRDDLFQRLKVMTLQLPPLRERLADIPVLVGQLLRRINEKVHKRVTRVPEDVMRHLVTLPWTGNVRELENALTRAVVLAPSDVLLLDDLPLLETQRETTVAKLPLVAVPTAAPAADSQPLSTLADMERRHIALAITACKGHKGNICQLLGISRPTLERKLQKYKLQMPARAEPDPEDPPSETALGR